MNFSPACLFQPTGQKIRHVLLNQVNDFVNDVILINIDSKCFASPITPFSSLTLKPSTSAPEVLAIFMSFLVTWPTWIEEF